MGADKEIIVAIELGATSIRAIAGKRMPDGSMQVLAIAQEETANAIRKGLVDNLDKTTQAITKVTTQLGNRLNVRVNRVYVGLCGQSLHTVVNKVIKTFSEKTQITNGIIDDLKDANRGMVYPNSRILEVIPQEYHIGNRVVTDLVGMQCEQIEATFLNVIARSGITEDVEKCINNAGLEVVDYIISPLALSDSLFTASEKRSGCAIVDMGAQTTSVAVYNGGILRHMIVIPLGGENVTKDIASKNLEFEEAEALKLSHGTAYRSNEELEEIHEIPITFGRKIKEDVLQEITEARYEEIILNIWEQIQHKSKLLSGITFVGGASRIKDLETAFTAHTKCDKAIRIVKGLPANITLEPNMSPVSFENLHTLLALLQKGTITCVCDMAKIEAVVQEEIDFEEKNEVKDLTSEEDTNQETRTTEETEEKKEEKEAAPEKPKGPTFLERIKKVAKKVNEMLTDNETR